MVDKVLLMNKEGEIIDSGTYEQLAERHQSFLQRQILDPSETLPEAENDVHGMVIQHGQGEKPGQLPARVDDLRRQKGNWRSYGFYLGSMGWLHLSIFLLAALFYVIFNAIFGVWLTWWAKDTDGNRSLGYWLGLYATWAIFITLGMLFTPM